MLAVAENRQSVALMQERMARTAPVPRQAFFYDSFQGVERFRKALVNMLTNTFMKVGRHNAHDVWCASGNNAVGCVTPTTLFNVLIQSLSSWGLRRTYVGSANMILPKPAV